MWRRVRLLQEISPAYELFSQATKYSGDSPVRICVMIVGDEWPTANCNGEDNILTVDAARNETLPVEIAVALNLTTCALLQVRLQENKPYTRGTSRVKGT